MADNMKSTSNHLMIAVAVTMLLQLCASAEEVNKGREATNDYCINEIFQPRCLKNEVIVMESATYGRMRIGRCITAEEVAAQKRLVGDDPQIVGCSANVLARVEQKCSGKTECDFRISDFTTENIKPCFPGLVMYLEVSYECINIVDDKRSCSVSASTNPVHILISSESETNCGSKFQPWTVEAPTGQKVSLSLIDFSTSPSTESGDMKQLCNSRGVIFDKAGRKNVTICTNGVHRSATLYQSKGNKIEIFTTTSDRQKSTSENTNMILKLEAVGCSDIIPPEDAWLKRSDDTIQIGCYSSRQIWQLSCTAGKWVGVLGNCSQSFTSHESSFETEITASILNEEQVLAMVAISGCTLAICLAIVCVGAVCLRRFYARSKNKQEYKTLNYSMNSARNQFMGQRNSTAVFVGNEACATDALNGPTYSVFVGETDLNESNTNPINSCHVAHSAIAQ